MTTTQIDKLKKAGWTFRHHGWQNHHNGDYEDDYLVKSPRLEKEFDVYHPFDDERVTLREVLKREKRAYVIQRLGSDEWGTNARRVTEAAFKALLKDPEAKSITITVRLK